MYQAAAAVLHSIAPHAFPNRCMRVRQLLQSVSAWQHTITAQRASCACASMFQRMQFPNLNSGHTPHHLAPTCFPGPQTQSLADTSQWPDRIWPPHR
jgi:hypothetical protein